jgi:hypothetical protein
MTEVGIEKFGEFDSSALEVKFTVNDIKIPFIKVFEFLDDHVNDKEGRLFEEGRLKAKREICDEIEQLQESVASLSNLLKNINVYELRNE